MWKNLLTISTSGAQLTHHSWALVNAVIYFLGAVVIDMNSTELTPSLRWFLPLKEFKTYV